jgi:crotonobetainyl-CoA:carnitine CoA-transferase CaiB-like acyl-CoA transferase
MTAAGTGAAAHQGADLSRVLAGPWAQTLGDLGAEVIKVERPGAVTTRAWGRPMWTTPKACPRGVYYMCTNRNKQSISVDFTRGEGQEIVRQLAARMRCADRELQDWRSGAVRA